MGTIYTDLIYKNAIALKILQYYKHQGTNVKAMRNIRRYISMNFKKMY